MFKILQYKARFITCLFFLNFSVMASIIKDDVVLVGEESYSFEKVCKTLTKRDSPLISFVSVTRIDCMGKVVDVDKFCDKKLAADPYYIRAVVDEKSKTVICKSAKRVHIKYQCSLKNDEYCQEKEIGCYLFQEKLAKRLKLEMASLLDEGESKVLSCHFIPKDGQNEIKSKIKP